jgi:hypothetical protein
MPLTFTYTGTSPSTVVNFLHNPQVGDWKKTRRWFSPSIEAAGGEDSFVKDKSAVLNFHVLTWGKLYDADRTALLAFLDVVDGISNAFDYVDPAGVSWTARIWNAREISESLVAYNRTEITIELLVVAVA